MKQKLIVLTVGSTPCSRILPLLTEHLPEEQVLAISLTEGLSIAEVMQRYAPELAEDRILTVEIQEDVPAMLSVAKVSRDLQLKIAALEKQGCELILLPGGEISGSLYANSAILLNPDRIVPPLVEAIVDDHQVGILVPRAEYIEEQSKKWRNLSKTPCFAIASSRFSDVEKLIDAGLFLQEQGADVVVLDSPGYHQRHRDFLQKLLGIPVVLSNMLIVKLAIELMG